MLRKNLLEVYPEPVEYRLKSVTVKLYNSESEHERLKAEIGTMLFGDQYDAHTHSNPNLTGYQAGELGATVVKYKRTKVTMENVDKVIADGLISNE